MPMKVRRILFVLAVIIFSGFLSVNAGQPVKIEYSRQALEAKWEVRVQSFLDKGVVPLIDLESAIGRKDGERHLDDSLAVMDEVIGMWATCLLLPKTIPWLVAAFLCFRVLDVVKPWPINRLERLPGGWGIMADDLAAGLVGALILNGLRIAFFD